MRKDMAAVLAVVAFVGGVVVGRYAKTEAGKDRSQEGSSGALAPISIAIQPEKIPSPFQGPENAKVTIVEVSDFQ